MKKIFLILFFVFIFIAQNSFARSAVEAVERGDGSSFFGFNSQRSPGFFGGLGFGYSNVRLKPPDSSTSIFHGWNSSVETGYSYNYDDNYGVVISAEYKMTDVTNVVDSATYMEKANFSQMNGKLGFYYNSLTFGIGLSKTNASVKNVSTTTISETQHFNGLPQLGFINYGFENNGLRATIELEYIGGYINHDIRYQDYSLGIHFNILF